MKKQSKEKWEDIFYFKWYLWDKDEQGSYTTCGEEVKEFIKELLSLQKKELIEKIKGMKSKGYKGLISGEDYVQSVAFDKVLSLLQEK